MPRRQWPAPWGLPRLLWQLLWGLKAAKAAALKAVLGSSLMIVPVLLLRGLKAATAPALKAVLALKAVRALKAALKAAKAPALKAVLALKAVSLMAMMVPVLPAGLKAPALKAVLGASLRLMMVPLMIVPMLLLWGLKVAKAPALKAAVVGSSLMMVPVLPAGLNSEDLKAVLMMLGARLSISLWELALKEVVGVEVVRRQRPARRPPPEAGSSCAARGRLVVRQRPARRPPEAGSSS